MKCFKSVLDAGDLNALVQEILEIKKNPHANKHLGENKTMGMIFLNPSLRTRLSTQKAAENLGMKVISLNMNDGWQLEMEDGTVMNDDKAEHVKEAAAVIGSYCDIIGIRSFANLNNRDDDYREEILNKFITHSGVPIVSLESGTLHPLQSLADLVTIEEFKTKPRPKVVMTWAPHPKALPQAVPNSFAQWMCKADVDFVITNPEGYDLDPQFTEGADVIHDQELALSGADFVYSKNWSSFSDYGRVLTTPRNWMIDERKMAVTGDAKFMHCLPVRRNVVVADEVIDGPNSIVIQQAANREFATQAVIKRMLEAL
ncbi:MAG: N-acetylornithine carbamoyltransferase [Flavobacteriales bacterium]|nr:N-acetylornithine carbamoyltransferase [Flavobacteriales bacterium]